MDTLTYARIRNTQYNFFALRKADSLIINSLDKEITILEKQKSTYNFTLSAQKNIIIGIRKDLYREKKHKKYLLWALPVAIIVSLVLK